MKNQSEDAQKKTVNPFSHMDEVMKKMHQNLGFNWGLRDPFDDDFFYGRNLDFTFNSFDKLIEREKEKAGDYVSQSYVTKTVTGPDNQPLTEKFIKNETSKIGKDGKIISEKSEFYDHTGNKTKRIIKERGLGNQKVIVTREIKDKEQHETRDLHNVDEQNYENFNKLWSEKAKEEKLYHFHNKFELEGQKVDPKAINAHDKKEEQKVDPKAVNAPEKKEDLKN